MQAGGQRLRAGIAAAGHGLRPTKERPDRAAAVRWAAAGPRRIRAAGVFASGCAFPVAAQRADASATALLPLCASSQALQSPAFVGGPSGASSSRSAAQQHLRCFVGPAGPPRYAARGRRSSLASPAPFMRHSGPPLVVGPPGARRPPGRGPRPPPQPGAPALLRWSGGRCPSAHGRRQPLSARLRAPAASLWSPLLAARGCGALTCLARCARAAGPPPAALFPPGLRSGGGRGRGSAALLRSAAPSAGGCIVGGLGACRGLPPPPSVPRPSGRGRRGVTTASGRGRGLTGPLPSDRIPFPGSLLRVSPRMHAAYKGPGLPEPGKSPLDKAAIRMVRCSRGVASAVSSQHRPRKGP